MPTLTAEYLYQFTDTGLVLNTDATPNAPFADVMNVKGLDSAPIRASQKVWEGNDGGFLDAEFENMRTIVIEGMLYCPQVLIDDFLDTLKGNYGPSASAQPFYFSNSASVTRTVFCKSLGVRFDTDTLRRIGSCKFQITLQAEDPTIYGNELVYTTGLTVGASGRGYNRSYNYGYGGTVGSGGTIAANNAGNKPANAILRFYDVIDPTVINDTNDGYLAFDIDIADGSYLEVRLRTKQVLLNGSANRRITLVGGSRWFLLNKGINYLRFLGTPNGPSPRLDVIMRPAYR